MFTRRNFTHFSPNVSTAFRGAWRSVLIRWGNASPTSPAQPAVGCRRNRHQDDIQEYVRELVRHGHHRIMAGVQFAELPARLRADTLYRRCWRIALTAQDECPRGVGGAACVSCTGSRNALMGCGVSLLCNHRASASTVMPMRGRSAGTAPRPAAAPLQTSVRNDSRPRQPPSVQRNPHRTVRRLRYPQSR